MKRLALYLSTVALIIAAVAVLAGPSIAAVAVFTGPSISESLTPTPEPSTGQAGLANPASVYCVEQGYRNEIRTAKDGSQFGVCVFPDGSEADDWAFFRGESGAKWRTPSLPLAR